MSHAKGQQPEDSNPNLSADAKAALNAKRETLVRVSKSDYPISEHTEALLQLIDSDD